MSKSSSTSTAAPYDIADVHLLQTVGEGAFGVVRLAVHRATGRRIAAKIIPIRKRTRRSEPAATKDRQEEEEGTNDRDRDRDRDRDHAIQAKENALVEGLRREIAIHRMLRHRNIIQLYSSSITPSVAFLYLELAAGGELFEKITPDVGLAGEVAHFYFRQLLNAVSYIHRLNIAHRDLKPENLLLDENGNLKLTDFGLATMYRLKGGASRPLKTPCGSPPYVAPEVLRGTYDGELCDVWSMGIILHLLRCGVPLWDEPTTKSPEFQSFVKDRHANKVPRVLAGAVRSDSALLELLLRLINVAAHRARLGDVQRHPWTLKDNPLYGPDGLCADIMRLASQLDTHCLAEVACHAQPRAPKDAFAALTQPHNITRVRAGAAAFSVSSFSQPIIVENNNNNNNNNSSSSSSGNNNNNNTLKKTGGGGAAAAALATESEIETVTVSSLLSTQYEVPHQTLARMSQKEPKSGEKSQDSGERIKKSAKEQEQKEEEEDDNERKCVSVARAEAEKMPLFPSRLTRFFTKLAMPTIHALLVSALRSQDVRVVVNPGEERIQAAEFHIFFTQLDAQGSDVLGVVRGQPVNSGLALVLFVRRRGDPLKFKRIYNCVTALPEIAKAIYS